MQLSKPSQEFLLKIAQNSLYKTSSPKPYSQRALKPWFAHPEKGRNTRKFSLEGVKGVQLPPGTSEDLQILTLLRETSGQQQSRAQIIPKLFPNGCGTQALEPREGFWLCWDQHWQLRKSF